ncbi:MAG: efflux transporter outer membrane subunit [Gammaproteobacteria bacterium]|nr:efflux transporter outer membrane subunit [Gammaproteobacteria bacterium]
MSPRLAWPLLLMLGGCSLAPALPDPAVNTPAAWKESPAQITGDWKVATPADDAARGQWWTVFRDPLLDGLVARASSGNQNLQAALARLEQSRAQVRVASAQRLPRIDLGVGASRIQPSAVILDSFGGGGPETLEDYTQINTRLSASYELDVFGRVRDSVKAAEADFAAQRALYESLTLSLQGDVAQTYFLIRATDEELRVLREGIKLREDTLQLVAARVAAGDTDDFDLERSRAELETARAELEAVARSRAAYEHALAVLCGETPAAFSLAEAPATRALPEIPPGLPSSLLERRPDVAAAERRMIAANARIGVAKAAFYPLINLTANFGVESGGVGELFKWSSRTWALGPIAGPLLSLPIFDGGRNKANLASAEASLDAEVAVYRQTVLDAFVEVEDSLSGLRTLATQRAALTRAVDSAQAASTIAEARFEAGATGLLEVLDARRNLLATQRLGVQVDGARAATTVALVRALGGGWQ